MARSIMIQGTMSSVGKSIITTGLCRILSKDGYKVAPFKSQNMSSLSYTLEDGAVISTAQFHQAKACNIAPSPLMNPILLKIEPMGCRVYINGEDKGITSSKNYSDSKDELRNIILDSYNKLSKDYDYIVIEGAGSPVEMNLNSNDIVNMGVAKITNSPVILVSDIERGGVFASLYGTLMLLPEDERSRIKGCIVNKFRGKRESIDSLSSKIEEITEKDLIGIVDYGDFYIDDEDNLSRYEDGKPLSQGDIEEQYDRVEKLLRRCLNIDRIYSILEGGHNGE
ncbi:MAG: cobyric acid synthase [Clostridium sp.]